MSQDGLALSRFGRACATVWVALAHGALRFRVPAWPRTVPRPRALAILCLVGSLAAPSARAQFAVIDIGAITQLISEVEILQDELTTARAHLAQAQAEYASITGGRGMEQLLAGAPRNYQPTNWADLQTVMQGGGGFGGLGAGVSATLVINSVLPDASLALLPPDVRKDIEERRRLTALQQNLTRQSLQTTSERFDLLQQLIAAIPRAADQKAVLDLQARTSAENAMLLNEQSKLRTLAEVIQAQERANEQQLQEQAALGQGQFAGRFQPVP
jgi:type IV secretion system protein VirB5